MKETHFLFVALATHGHFNPGLQFAKILTRRGLHVTFVSSESVIRRLGKTPPSERLSFASFSDGYDDGVKPGDDIPHFLSEFERRGSIAIKDMIESRSLQGHQPFTFVGYSLLTPWVAEVARSLHLPSAVLWNQSTIVFDIYYYYFNGYEDEIRKICNDPFGSIQLPGLPLLYSKDLPSHMHSSTLYKFALSLFRKHFEVLEQETNPKILINSFEDLEHDAFSAISKFNLMPIGPLLSSVYLDGSDSSSEVEKSSGSMKPYIQWLNSNPKSSVVYVSFGSLAMLPKPQLEEVARGLLDSKRPFLWVMREIANGVIEEEILSCRRELEEQGKIIPWCSQVEILSNEAIGCFITHCGWNSSLESVSFGVPVVAFPQWFDQETNAKVLGDLLKIGVKLNVNKEGLVEGEEIKRCLELVMGDGVEGEKLRRNAVKWKELAEKAVTDGGSSDVNLKNFVDHVCKC